MTFKRHKNLYLPKVISNRASRGNKNLKPGREKIEQNTLPLLRSVMMTMLFIAPFIASWIKGMDFSELSFQRPSSYIFGGFREAPNEHAKFFLPSLAEEGNDLVMDIKQNEEGQLIYSIGDFELLETHSHDERAFTQGLTYFNGDIYEGTGLYGRSSLRKLQFSDLSLPTKISHLSGEYFGEGISYFKDSQNNDRFIQLTWREKTAFIYDAHTLEVVDQFEFKTYTGEGWGITYDDTKHEFIVSDGSEHLFFWDADTYEEIRRLKVHLYMGTNFDVKYVKLLNELEFMPSSSYTFEGKRQVSILANVWYENIIIEIDPASGAVVKVFDVSSLCPARIKGGENVMNGISVIEDKNAVLITGKLWGEMYTVKLI